MEILAALPLITVFVIGTTEKGYVCWQQGDSAILGSRRALVFIMRPNVHRAARGREHSRQREQPVKSLKTDNIPLPSPQPASHWPSVILASAFHALCIPYP